MTSPVSSLVCMIIAFLIFGLFITLGLFLISVNNDWVDKHFKKFVFIIFVLVVVSSGILGYVTLSQKPSINTYQVTKIANSEHANAFTITYINKSNRIKSINVYSDEIKVANKGKNKITITDYKYSVGGYVKAYINKKDLESLMK